MPTEQHCASFPPERYFSWPLKIDKKRDTLRTYQTGSILSDGDHWSFMVEIGRELGKTGTAKSENWFKFFVIKQDSRVNQSATTEHTSNTRLLSQKKLKFIKKKSFACESHGRSGSKSPNSHLN